MNQSIKTPVYIVELVKDLRNNITGLKKIVVILEIVIEMITIQLSE